MKKMSRLNFFVLIINCFIIVSPYSFANDQDMEQFSKKIESLIQEAQEIILKEENYFDEIQENNSKSKNRDLEKREKLFEKNLEGITNDLLFMIQDNQHQKD